MGGPRRNGPWLVWRCEGSEIFDLRIAVIALFINMVLRGPETQTDPDVLEKKLLLLVTVSDTSIEESCFSPFEGTVPAEHASRLNLVLTMSTVLIRWLHLVDRGNRVQGCTRMEHDTRADRLTPPTASLSLLSGGGGSALLEAAGLQATANSL